jgi:hypothetical protein
LDGPVIVGRTAVGRTTVMLLQINHPLWVEQRAALIEAQLFSTEVL